MRGKLLAQAQAQAPADKCGRHAGRSGGGEI